MADEQALAASDEVDMAPSRSPSDIGLLCVNSADRRHFAPSIVDLLHGKFDPEAKQLITSFEPENGQIFVDEERLSHLGLTLRDLARFLESQPFLFAVFTNDDVRRAADSGKPVTPTRIHTKYK